MFRYEPQLVEGVARTLQLRAPNQAALHALAERMDGADVGAELIAVLATGVGKTYIAGGLIDYVWEAGGRNVVVITPGSAIQVKTLHNFTPGHRKALAGLGCDPVVVTLDDYEQGTVADVLDDPSRMKVFVLTVQSLLERSRVSRTGRASVPRSQRPHETVGRSLIDHLAGLDDLVVVADEHHVYFAQGAKKFRAAVEQLEPQVTVGLTATPHEDTDPESVVYRYSLAEAIADRFVKIPVLVARPDGLADDRTKLADGVALLNTKRDAVVAYCGATGVPFVEPVMFVVAQTIEEANELAAVLREPDLLGPDAVLTVTSDESPEHLAMLDTLEDETSPIRAVVSVSMLGLGWDVKNVWVIAAVRALESDMLTEQILGRGLRLPFGRRTGTPMLDTVEVLSHQSFRQLLRQAKALLHATVGERADATVAAIAGSDGAPATQLPIALEGVDDEAGNADTVTWALPGTQPAGSETGAMALFDPDTTVGGIATVASRIGAARADTATLATVWPVRNPNGVGTPLYLPRVTSRWVRDPFVLADVDVTAIAALGRKWADEAAAALHRKVVDARRDNDGVELDIHDASDQVSASQAALSVDAVVDRVTTRLVRSDVVEQTLAGRNAAQAVATAFVDGAGPATERWSEDHTRAAAEALVSWLGTKQAEMPRHEHHDVQLLQWPEPPDRHLTRTPLDRYQVTTAADLVKHHPYIGWSKSFYATAAFDAWSTEFRLAELFDSDAAVAAWSRIDGRVPLTIAYRSGNRLSQYRPDFLVIDTAKVIWVVEGKSDKDFAAEDVVAKRDAATAWVDLVNGSSDVHDRWAYLLAAEATIAAASSWHTLVAGAFTRT